MAGENSIQTEVTALLIPRAHDSVFIPAAQQAKRESSKMQGTNPSGSIIRRKKKNKKKE